MNNRCCQLTFNAHTAHQASMSPVKYIKLQESQCLMLVASAVIGAIVVVVVVVNTSEQL